MEPTYSVLLDAPAERTKRIQIARLGPVKDPRYGEFAITEENVASWKRNLSHLPGQRALIDFEHRSERKPRDSQAAGWITDINLDGEKVMADAEWTDRGEEAIRNKRYLFLSPAYGTHRDEQGNEYENTLCSTALTNKPVLCGLPMLTLASEESLQAAIDADPAARRLLADEQGSAERLLDALSAKQRSDLPTTAFAIPGQRAYPIHDLSHARNALARVAQHGTSDEQAQVRNAVYKRYPQLKPSDGDNDDGPSDSRRTMDTEILKALDLDDTADSTKVLDAIGELKTKATAEPPKPPEPTKTLEQQAADSGKRLLDAEEFRALEAKANAGEAAMHALKEQRFETVFELALKDSRGPRVTPAEKDSLQHFYALDADATVKLIEDREPIVPAKPTGEAHIDLSGADIDTGTLVQHGLHPGSHALDQKVKARLKELGKPSSDYTVVLDQMLAEGAAV